MKTEFTKELAKQILKAILIMIVIYFCLIGFESNFNYKLTKRDSIIIVLIFHIIKSHRK
jgi:type III secretory pathway component EscU